MQHQLTEAPLAGTEEPLRVRKVISSRFLLESHYNLWILRSLGSPELHTFFIATMLFAVKSCNSVQKWLCQKEKSNGSVGWAKCFFFSSLPQA